jgi:glycogen synthase
MKVKSVCLVCNEYPPGPNGGIGTMTQVLGRALVRAGLEVRVIGLYPRHWAAPDYEEDHGVRVWRRRWKPGRLGWVQSRYELFQQITAWSEAGEVDLVEVPDWEGMAAGWRPLAVPVVVRANGSDCYFSAELGFSSRRALRLAERASMKRADAWCAVSSYLGDRTQQLFRLSDGPRAILYNPVELPTPAPDARRVSQRVVFTGTLTPKKGVITLMKAWPHIKARFADAQLHLFGKDTEWNGQSMCAQLVALLDDDCRASVVFHGHVAHEQVLEGLRSAHVAVFPSYAEGMGIAPIEAMACGCPTVFGRCGTDGELIEQEREGLIVDPDSPEKIAHAIERILEDEKLAARLGEAGRNRVVRDFSVEALLERNLAFYDDSISEFGARKAS